LGDRDLATHLYRTQRLADGATLSEVTAEIGRAWELRVRLLPMTDDPVETRVTIREDGREPEVGFQEYFVGRRHDVPVVAVRFAGVTSATPAPGVLQAIDHAELVIISPSNPMVSVGPIRALPGVDTALERRRESVVAVSPIIAGTAVKGPADRMLRDLGHEPTVVGVARLYRPVVGTLVIDEADADLADEVERAGVRPIVAPTLMHGPGEAAALAKTVLNARPASGRASTASRPT
jgi:LPPG:FO 2-phospho-L-lactate transferase